jgi:hypothetical protein
MDHLARALRELTSRGLLLLQDPALPNLVSMLLGETIRGSWWGHPAAKLIFQVANELDDLPDVMTTKLVSKKVTFVHRTLFPALVAIGKSKEGWQLEGLGASGKRLLSEVESDGPVQTSGRDAKTLEERLLVYSAQVHTKSGEHALELSSWASYQKRNKLGRLPSLITAKKSLETAAALLSKGTKARATLPWQSARV